MKLIIDISEKDYRRGTVMASAIRNGIPLPKGCGRLIDADAYLKKVCTYKETGCGSCRFQTVCPVDEPTIIEGGEQNV